MTVIIRKLYVLVCTLPRMLYVLVCTLLCAMHIRIPTVGEVRVIQREGLIDKMSITSKCMHGMSQMEAEYSRHGKWSQRASLSQIGPVGLEV